MKTTQQSYQYIPRSSTYAISNYDYNDYNIVWLQLQTDCLLFSYSTACTKRDTDDSILYCHHWTLGKQKMFFFHGREMTKVIFHQNISSHNNYLKPTAGPLQCERGNVNDMQQMIHRAHRITCCCSLLLRGGNDHVSVRGRHTGAVCTCTEEMLVLIGPTYLAKYSACLSISWPVWEFETCIGCLLLY